MYGAYETTNRYLTEAFELLALSTGERSMLLTPARELRVELTYDCTLRAAAFALAVSRVKAATDLRGLG